MHKADAGPSWTDKRNHNLYRKIENVRIKHVKIRDSVEIQEHYQYRHQIGKGTFGTVYEVREKRTDILFALKIIEKGKLGNKRSDVEREIGILKIVNHPHIIHLKEIFESSRKYFLVFDLCHGTLRTILKERIKLTEEEVQKILCEVTSAVVYLHKKDIVHRDLKLENILLAQNPDDPEDLMYVKVSDFGLSVIMTEYSHNSMLTDFCGTTFYMSPEILSSQSYSQQCDVWAIGIIMYMLLTGNFPFYHKINSELKDMICTEPLDLTNLKISSESKILISKMLEKNPAFRITSVELEIYPWLTGIKGPKFDSVFDKMKRWKTELKSTDIQETSDWLAAASVEASNDIDLTKKKICINTLEGAKKNKRQNRS